MQNHNTPAAGFTLIEVLVALSILALGIAGSAKLTEMGYRQVAATDNYQRAAYLAHSHLNTLSTQPEPTTLEQSGQYDERFRWHLIFTPIGIDDIFASSASRSQLHSSQENAGKMTDKVNALQADLTVLFENDTRTIKFHTLLLFGPET